MKMMNQVYMNLRIESKKVIDLKAEAKKIVINGGAEVARDSQ